MKLLIFVTTILAVNAFTAHEQQWSNFKVKHSKIYKNHVEERVRFEIFHDNLKKIEEHNARYEAGLESYWMAVNQFADLTQKEFGALLRTQNGKMPDIQGTRHISNDTAPESIDWREKNAVLYVKNQGTCGSCWAFSATGAMEGQNAILNNKRVPLSEQQLLDCSGSYGNGDCTYGGEMTAAFQYVKDNGIVSEEAYPYTEVQGRCNYPSSSILNVTGYKNVDKNEEALKNAVGTVGPISVSMYSRPIQFYGGGIFNDPACYSDIDLLDHGVLVVAYGIERGQEFWTIKNSWGSLWGEDGYFRMERGKKRCGVQLKAVYPVL